MTFTRVIFMSHHHLLPELRRIAKAAGQKIIEFHGSEKLKVQTKADKSPVTAADLAAHQIILEGLTKLSRDLPILSEEAANISWAQRRDWETYWLVDPLDGTKEFIKGNGEFTVNISLVEHRKATLGVVYAPIKDWMYSGCVGHGAEKISAGRQEAINARNITASGESVKIVASRSHNSEKLDSWLEALAENFPRQVRVSMGSSLKLCLIAEGKADIYPRFTPTSEWDTAASHAILSAAGGRVVDLDHKELAYNGKESLINPNFIALGGFPPQWLPRIQLKS